MHFFLFDGKRKKEGLANSVGTWTAAATVNSVYFPLFSYFSRIPLSFFSETKNLKEKSQNAVASLGSIFCDDFLLSESMLLMVDCGPI